MSIRPLINYCVHTPYDHTHNARIDDELYAQRSLTKTVFSSVKRPLDVGEPDHSIVNFNIDIIYFIYDIK
jgi:hypothetical protein